MKKTSVFCAVVCASAFLFNSCQEKDLYQGSLQEQKEKLSGFDYSKQFENFGYYDANITSEDEGGCYYAVFTEYPYNSDMDMVVEPILSGRTPINAQFAVPNGTEELYVVSCGTMTTYPVGNLTITDQNAGTRADALDASEFSALKKMVDNTLLPEAHYNLHREDLYKCTDLVNMEENTEVSTWVAYLGGSVPRKVWYYTYKGTNTPTMDDCTFYWRVNGKDVKTTFAEIKATDKNAIISGNNSELNVEKLLDVKLQVGDHLGFVYHSNLGWRFTTPSLNTPPYTTQDGIFSKGELKGQPWPEDNPVGSKIPYNDGTFEIEQNVFGGAIMHFECNGHEYNIVGFENRLPGQTTQDDGNRKGFYDGDYNDMLFLVRTNPESIKPVEELPVPNLVFKTIRTGVWIFEDNYPETGDLDFNDVVVYYEIQKCDDMMEIDCWLAATGCIYSNEVGIMVLPNKNKDSWKKPTITEVLWKGVRGNRNVGSEPANLNALPHKKVRVTCADYQLLRPYLNNGNGIFSLEDFNKSEYPYAMDIPAYIGSTRNADAFRWMQEHNSIDEGYYFLRNAKGGARSSDWYKKPKDASKTVTIADPFFKAIE